jgi:hypothetical protein
MEFGEPVGRTGTDVRDMQARHRGASTKASSSIPCQGEADFVLLKQDHDGGRDAAVETLAVQMLAVETLAAVEMLAAVETRAAVACVVDLQGLESDAGIVEKEALGRVVRVSDCSFKGLTSANIFQKCLSVLNRLWSVNIMCRCPSMAGTPSSL